MRIPAYVRLALGTLQYDEDYVYIQCSPFIYIEGNAETNLVSVYWCNKSRKSFRTGCDLYEEKVLVVQVELCSIDLELIKTTIENYIFAELHFLIENFKIEFDSSLLDAEGLYFKNLYGK